MPARPTSPRRAAPARRGSIYVLALGASTLVVIAGLSVIAITRAQGRATDAERDSTEAALAARSGIEIAAASINAIADWRTTFRSSAPIGPLTVGRAQITLFLTDETDGNLANNPAQPVRATAVARVGSATRALSALLNPPPAVGAPSLETAALAGGPLEVDTDAPLVAGALASRSRLTTSANLTADVRAPVVTSTAYINGRVTTGPDAAPPLPDATAWNTLRPLATDIPFGSLSSGKIDRHVLSPASNPLGPTNPRGIYHITVPSNKLLEITRSRLSATLLVTLSGNAGLKLVDEVLWAPPRPDQPALIVSGPGSKGVELEASGSPLSESAANSNFNPAGTPYNGSSDALRDDQYPNQLQGVFHVMHPSTAVTLGNYTSLTGSLIVAGTLRITEFATLAPDPALLTAPPIGYAKATGLTMQVEPGSYQWVVEFSQSR